MEHFSCPECSYENLKGALSCKRCLLVFEKYERKNLKTGITVSGSKALEEQWRELLSEYDNLEKHEKFISDAVKEKNLPFASQQYKKMLDLNSADEMAKKMIDRIIQVATLTYVPPFRKEPPKNTRWITKLVLFMILFIFAIVIVQAFLKKSN